MPLRLVKPGQPGFIRKARGQLTALHEELPALRVRNVFIHKANLVTRRIPFAFEAFAIEKGPAHAPIAQIGFGPVRRAAVAVGIGFACDEPFELGRGDRLFASEGGEREQ